MFLRKLREKPISKRLFIVLYLFAYTLLSLSVVFLFDFPFWAFFVILAGCYIAFACPPLLLVALLNCTVKSIRCFPRWYSVVFFCSMAAIVILFVYKIIVYDE